METQINPYQSPAEPVPLPPSTSRSATVFAGAMSFDEVLQFETLITGRKRKTLSKFDWGTLWAAFAATLVWAFYQIFVYAELDFLFETVSGVLLAGGFLVALFVNERHRKRNLEELQANQTGAFSPIAGERLTTGLRFLVDDYPIDYSWDDCVGFRSSKDVVVIYVEFPNVYNFVAASFFESLADWESFKVSIETNLQRVPKSAFLRKRAKGKMSFVLSGTSHLTSQKWNKAIKAFDQALSIDENDLQATRGRGIAHIHGQNYAAAASDLNRAIEDLGARDLMTRRLRSVALLANEEYSRALNDLDHLYERLKDDPDILRDRGLALQKLGRFEEAIELYDAAIALNEQDGIAYNNRGASLIELGRLQEAIRDLERAIELVPEVPKPREHLARAKEMVTSQANN